MNTTIFNLSAQGAGTVNKDFDLPEGYKGGVFFLNISATGGTPTLDIKLQNFDNVGGVYTDVVGASFAQKSGTGSAVLSVYPGLTASANVAVTQVLAKSLRAVAVVAGSGTPTFTFTLSASPVK